MYNVHLLSKQPKASRLTVVLDTAITLDPAYNEFGYNEHPAVMNRYLCIKIIDCNIKMFLAKM